MQDISPHLGAPEEGLPGMACRYLPLVPRPRPACPALRVRVAQVRDLARAAAEDTSDSLRLAAEAHNLTALIMSDCGLPAQARTLCWQQYEVLRAAPPATAATAKLTLQPIVNLSRLLARDGDGPGAYRLLRMLFEAVRNRTDMVIDGRTLTTGDLVGRGDDHDEVTRWLWSVLLADGTRALARAGLWAAALQHARQHKGIGTRLLDGRQVAIIAHCAARDYGTAARLLAGTSAAAPWEEAVAACLRTLRLTLAGRPADAAITTLTDTYTALETGPGHAMFRVRLGLCAIDLAGDDHRKGRIADIVLREALQAADAHAARDALAHPACATFATAADHQALTEIVRMAGLGRRTIPGELLDDLMESVKVSEESMTSALSPRTPPSRKSKSPG